MKEAMHTVIELYNKELESNPEAPTGEESVKRLAHMFKLIDMENEGIKFYTNFIMVGKHNQTGSYQASEQSTMKQIENVIISMYQSVEECKQKIMEEHQVAEVKSFQLLEECQISTYYAEFQRILIACIEDYGESITNLFGIDSLLLFIDQIDKVSKEKGTQIIEHFLHNSQLDHFHNLLSRQHQTDFQLLPDQEFEIDLLCEEICNFSYYYQNYRIYVLNFLYTQLGADLNTHAKQEKFERV